MAETSIQWCDHSINPIRARVNGSTGHVCQKISPGCANCYASRLQKRFGMPEFKGAGAPVTAEVFMDEGKLREVLRRKKPTKYFWCDMTDMFGDWVTDEMIDRCFAVMALTPQHTHQVLTKRPERMLRYLTTLGRQGRVNDSSILRDDRYVWLPTRDGPEGPAWPLPNVWLGVSVEDQARADERIPLLLQCPAAVRFLSVEPLLGPVDLVKPAWVKHDAFGRHESPGGRRFPMGIGWVIVGGESGPGARECSLAWVESIVDQCRHADVACFVKQLGSRPTNLYTVAQPSGAFLDHWPPRDKKGGDMQEWPESLRVREFPERSPTNG